MTFRPLIAAAALAATLASAQAAEIAPNGGRTIELGSLSGVAYYTTGPTGYHVVVTLAPRAAAPVLRFETTLASEQSVTVSTPGAFGGPSDSVNIRRVGEQVIVSRAKDEDRLREADATH